MPQHNFDSSCLDPREKYSRRMRLDNGMDRTQKLIKLGLIALVIYFSQVYPYLHFHHTHDGSADSHQVVSLPADAKTHHSHHAHDHHGHDHDAAPHESGESHHHHAFDQHVDWYLSRSHSDNLERLLDHDHVWVLDELRIVPNTPRHYPKVDPMPRSKPAYKRQVDSRGPPLLG